MTDTPDLPPTPVPTSLPPETPAGRPRIWQAALLFVAFGVLAGGSCAAFLNHPSGGSSDAWTLLFILAMPFAAGAFALLVFRLWRRRVAESWPSLGQAALMVFAGGVLAVGGCGGWAATMDVTALMPVAVVLGAAFVLGTALAIGAGELFLIAMARLMVAPRR
jgi:MFS family permease